MRLTRWLQPARATAVVLALALLLGAGPGQAGGVAAAAPIPGAIQITTRDAYRFQGWGTSLAWWANVVGGWRSAPEIEDALFGLPKPGHQDRLGLNVMRYDVGASPVL